MGDSDWRRIRDLRFTIIEKMLREHIVLFLLPPRISLNSYETLFEYSHPIG